MPFDTSTYSGYGQSMRDFANSVGKFSERIAQRREEEKQLKALKSAYRPFAEDLGFMSPEEFDNADAREITRRIQAQHFKAGLDELQQQRRLRDSIQAFGRDYGTGPQAPIQEGGDIGVPFALGEYAPQPNQGAANGAMGQPPATAIQRYAETPPAGNIDRLNYALGRNPEALMSPQVGEFIGNLSRLEAVRAQQQRMNAPAAIEDYLDIGKTVDLGNGAMIVGLGAGRAPQVVQTSRSERKVERDPSSVTELTTKDGKPTGKGMLNDGTIIDLSPTQSEGKELTATELNQIAALNQAEKDINALEELYAAQGKDYGGPIAGPVRSAGAAIGFETEMGAIESAITAATPNLARGVFREVGVLTDEDVKRYRSLIPSPNDTETVRQKKFQQLRKRIDQGKRETLDAMKRAGRNVSGFAAEPGAPMAAPSQSGAGTNAVAPAPAQLPRYKTEQDAIKAGLKPGSVFLLYDPRTAQYYITQMQ